MSVILDALKKAQKERKRATKTLPYNPGEKFTEITLVYLHSCIACLLRSYCVFIIAP